MNPPQHDPNMANQQPPAQQDAAQQAPVNAVHFQDLAAFLEQDRLLAQESRQAAQREHEQRLALQLEATAQAKADAEAKRIPPCDGSNPDLLRNWMRDVDMATNYSDRAVYIAAHSATGDLRVELEHHLAAAPNRHRVTWDALKKYLADAFLLPNEDERLRTDITKMKQGPYETCASYGRRFRTAADLAYPPRITNVGPARSDVENRLLRDAYIIGLRDKPIRQKLTLDTHPDTYQQAIYKVSTLAADNTRWEDLEKKRSLLLREDEPMEIGMMQAPHQHRINRMDQCITEDIRTQPQAQLMPISEPSLSQDVKELKRQMSGLVTQFTKLMASQQTFSTKRSNNQQTQQQQQQQQPRQNQYTYAFTPEGRPICAYCSKPNHLARECLKRKADRQNQQMAQLNQGEN
jgi:hypothetical protein